MSGGPFPDAQIRTVAAVIVDAGGRVLLVRKQGSDTFIQPGGKREPGETALQTLARELREEQGVELCVESARRLGEFEDAAVNEPGRRVRGEAYAVRVVGTPQAGAEIGDEAEERPLDVALVALLVGGEPLAVVVGREVAEKREQGGGEVCGHDQALQMVSTEEAWRCQTRHFPSA